MWAKRQGIEFSSMADLASRQEVAAEVQQAVDDCNRQVARAESVRKFTILPVEWTAESEELTPTLKLKRRVIVAKYAPEIELMYSTPMPASEPAAPADPTSAERSRASAVGSRTEPSAPQPQDMEATF